MESKVESPKKGLKLALYHPWIYLHGGLERSILQMISGSRHQWTVFTGYYDAQGTFPGFAAHDVRTLHRTSIRRGMSDVLKSAIQVARQKLSLEDDVDAIVVCCDGIGDLLTFRNHHLPVFNICFTPLRPVFDPSYEAQALSKRGPAARALYALFREAFRIVDRRAWRHYSGVVAISEEVKRRIVAGRLCTADQVVVAYPGIHWSPQAPDVQYESFILVSGRVMWTKNIELAIRAFTAARLPAPWKLVIAGYVDKKSEVYLLSLRELAGSHENIEFVLSPTDEVMADLLRRASFGLFTAFNEDWGIVPLEAMASAKPVIAVDSGGPRESIVHGETGYLLPADVGLWAATMQKLVEDPALVQRLGAQAHAHVRQFSWEHFNNRIDETLACWIANAYRAGPEISDPGEAAFAAGLPGG